MKLIVELNGELCVNISAALLLGTGQCKGKQMDIAQKASQNQHKSKHWGQVLS